MFKVGDRVRYTGRDPQVCYHPQRKGRGARVISVPTANYEGRYFCGVEFDGEEKLGGFGISCLNLEFCEPRSPFEADLIAYIEREKRELGI